MPDCPHELDPASCVICRAPKGNRRRVPAIPGPAFTARYAGRCPGCPFGIEPGELVRRFADRVWHARCAEVASP